MKLWLYKQLQFFLSYINDLRNTEYSSFDNRYKTNHLLSFVCIKYKKEMIECNQVDICLFEKIYYGVPRNLTFGKFTIIVKITKGGLTHE